MPRKSVITRLPADQRTFVEKLLREDRLTLDEMIAAISAQFPTAVPSRSALHRYQASQREITERMRLQDKAARAIVTELGEQPDERAGALLVQAVTTIATDVAMRMNESEVTIEEVRKLARAAKDTIQARQSSLKERQSIEQAARDRLVREQKEKLARVEKKGGLDPETLRRIREEVYGITT